MPPLKVRLSERPLRALVFDIENRPLSYWYDRPTAEVTVISYKWYGQKKTHVLMLDPSTPVSGILEDFRPIYDKAEVVIGHNIRSHDLKILDGAYVEQKMPGLTPKLSVDTYRDLRNWKDIPKSLEYLADWLGAPYKKFHMTQHSWRVANRLEPEGLSLARQRCAIDVQVNEWVYDEVRRLGYLEKPPRVWKP